MQTCKDVQHMPFLSSGFHFCLVLFLTPSLSLSLLCLFSVSDYIIKEKTVLLQKKDSEGFGFVLRGAKGKKCEIHTNILPCNHTHWFSYGKSNCTWHALIMHSHSHIFSPAQTPIEEFTPTPAFPALQYLESVDEGGVAWRAGLRMGDFLIEVIPWFTTVLWVVFSVEVSETIQKAFREWKGV